MKQTHRSHRLHCVKSLNLLSISRRILIQSNDTSGSHSLLIVMVVEQIIFKKRWEFRIIFVESVSHCRKYGRGGIVDNPLFNYFSNQTPCLRGMG